MTQTPYTPPNFRGSAFNCVLCGAYAEQRWGQPHFFANNAGIGQLPKYWTSRCSRCEAFSFWVEGQLVFPVAKTAPAQNPDLPEGIAADYEEARLILHQS